MKQFRDIARWVLLTTLGLLLVSTWVEAGGFLLSSESSVLEYESSGQGDVTVPFYFEVTPPGDHLYSVQGWSISLIPGSSAVGIDSVEQGEFLLTMNGGAGPDYYQAAIYPEGLTIAVVYSLFGTPRDFEGIEEVFRVTFHANGVPAPGEESVDLRLEPLGDPPVASVIIVNGTSIPYDSDLGLIELTSAPGQFRRGDCNQDVIVDLADSIFLADSLFAAGASATCDDACDANDDGLTDIADVVSIPSYLFGGGSPPPTPLLECGLDPTPDSLGCEMSVCP